jgi:hypothetical protein
MLNATVQAKKSSAAIVMRVLMLPKQQEALLVSSLK